MFSRLPRADLRIHIAALSVLCGLLFVPPLWSLPFFNKGEPREALVVQSIVGGENWLFPLKIDGGIPSKPPLFHWAGALTSIAWGDVTEATVRFPSALFATLGVLIIYVLGRKLFDAKTAFLGGVVLATTLLYQSLAIVARVDMTLAFFITATLAIFYALYRDFLTREVWYYVFFAVLGLGVLAKGPVSLILSAIVVLSFLSLQRRWEFLSRLCFHKGVLLAAAIFISWYGLGIVEGGEGFFDRQVIKENLARFFVHGEEGTGHQKPFYYYIPYLFGEGLPWSLFIPFVGMDLTRRLRRDGKLDEDISFLSIWFLAVFLFFSLSAGKRSDYLLPLFPPASLLIGAWFYKSANSERYEKIALRCLGGIFSLTGLFALGLLFDYIWNNESGGFLAMLAQTLEGKDQANLLVIREAFSRTTWLYPGSLFICSLLLLSIARNFWNFKAQTVTSRLTLTVLLAAFVTHGVVTPAIAESRSYRPFMEEVNRRVPEREPLFIFGEDFDSSSLTFYRGAPIPLLQETPGRLLERLRRTNVSIIMTREDWQKIQAGNGNLPSPVLQSKGNGADGDDPLVLIRGNGGPSPDYSSTLGQAIPGEGNGPLP